MFAPARAEAFGQRTAIADASGVHSYADLLHASGRIAGATVPLEADLWEARIRFGLRPAFRGWRRYGEFGEPGCGCAAGTRCSGFGAGLLS